LDDFPTPTVVASEYYRHPGACPSGEHADGLDRPSNECAGFADMAVGDPAVIHLPEGSDALCLVKLFASLGRH
jgi:hypothetical protein